MSHFDALMYAAGLLVAWVGFIWLTVALFVAAGRADDEAGRCDCEGCDQCS